MNRIRNLTFRVLAQYIIWILAVCAMLLTFYRKATPIYTEETLNSVHPINTPELKPGEYVSQSFRSSYDCLYNVGVAISYQNDISEDTSVLIQVLSGEELVVEQGLSIWYCPDSSFCTLLTNLQDCQGETITIRVENTSPASDNASFSLLATDKNYLYLDNTDNYRLNGEEQNARLLFTSSYRTDYSCYNALTYSFWIFLAALIASSLISRRRCVL